MTDAAGIRRTQPPVPGRAPVPISTGSWGDALVTPLRRNPISAKASARKPPRAPFHAAAGVSWGGYPPPLGKGSANPFRRRQNTLACFLFACVEFLCACSVCFRTFLHVAFQKKRSRCRASGVLLEIIARADGG